MKLKSLKIALLGLACLAAVLPAAAQENYPNRPITIVVPFGPGSGTDLGARLIGQKLADSMGQAVTIDNKPGANGVIAADLVAGAKPDGYTLIMGTNSTHGANPALVRDLRYDPVKSFEPINRVGIFSSVIVVNPSLPIKTLAELVAYGKKHELTLATGNTSGIVMGETLARQVGIKVLRIPFKSNPDAIREVVAGRVNIMFTDIASAKGLLSAGSVRPIAMTTAQRSTVFPEVPTAAEAGVADYDLAGWIGLFAPAGTPRPILEKLNAEVAKALQQPDVRERLLGLGAEPAAMPLAQFVPWSRGEVTKWVRLVKEAGIEPQ